MAVERNRLGPEDIRRLPRDNTPVHKRKLSRYKDEMAELVYNLCMLGATNDRIAAILKVSLTTFETWTRDKEEVKRALFDGREGADMEIAKALYHRAKGYSHKSVKIFMSSRKTKIVEGTGSDKVISEETAPEVVTVPFVEHYPPETGAISMWLSNRQRAYWKVRQDNTIANPDDTPLEIPQLVIVPVQAVEEED